MVSTKRFQSFQEFWPFYLNEHQHPWNKRLHYWGISGALILAVYALWANELTLMWLMPLIGYGFAWAGHFLIEKNRPATFQYPLWSLRGDFKMWFLILTNRL